MVLEDVYNGKVSVKAAADDYGVVVSGPPWCVNNAETCKLRVGRKK
jgi:hypothetical protein